MDTNDFVDWMKEMQKVFENEFGEMVCAECNKVGQMHTCVGNRHCECCMACQENIMRKMNKDELHNWLQNKSRKSRNKKKYYRPAEKRVK